MMRLLHGLVRRYWTAIERVITAGALAGLLYLLMQGLPAYPLYWDLVLTGIIFGAALGSPPLGYFLAATAALYPIYNVSIYLMVLFLAVALLGQRIFINNLGATLLTLAAPLFGQIYLPWVTPVLGGLWWGPVGGLVIGGLAALWGQVLSGMQGLSPDWTLRLGGGWNPAALAERFTGIDSLATLWRLVEPFAPDSTSLLLFLLQVGLWGAVGSVLGTLAEKPWAQRRRPTSGVALAWLGVSILLVGHVFSGLWLQQYTPAFLIILSRPLGLSFALSGLAVSLFELLHDLVEYPLVIPLSRRGARPGLWGLWHAPEAVQSEAVKQRSSTAATNGRLTRGSIYSRPSGENGLTAPVKPVSLVQAAGTNSLADEGPARKPANSPDEGDSDDLIMLELD